MEKIAELESVKIELESFLEVAKNEKTKDILNCSISQITNEMQKLNTAASTTSSNSRLTASRDVQGPRKIVSELNQYALDESEKFVKLYFPLPDGISALKEEDVKLDLKESGFSILVETPARNYKFTVTSLLHKIDIDKSYKKIKASDGMVVVFLKKSKEGLTWKFLTTTEKALKDNKEKMFDKDSDDPNSALMNIMKKMYESGDPEMKRTIAKAWTEGQEKNKANPAF